MKSSDTASKLKIAFKVNMNLLERVSTMEAVVTQAPGGTPFLFYAHRGSMALGTFFSLDSLEPHHPDFPNQDGFLHEEIEMEDMSLYPSEVTGHNAGTPEAKSISRKRGLAALLPVNVFRGRRHDQPIWHA